MNDQGFEELERLTEENEWLWDQMKDLAKQLEIAHGRMLTLTEHLKAANEAS